MEIKELSLTIQIYNQEEVPSKFLPLIEEAKKKALNAYAPYSKFKVGAAVLVSDGQIFGGNNQENAAYPSGLCAERTALFYANANAPLCPPTAIAIASFYNGFYSEMPISPCGNCRQVLIEAEMRYKHPIQIILWGSKKTYIIEKATDLLPLSFSKENL